jgi:hypothetical protein
VETPALQVACEDNRKHNLHKLVPVVMNAPAINEKPVSEKSFPKAEHNTCTYWSGITHELKLDAIDSAESKSRKFGSKNAWCPRGNLLEKWNEDLLPQALGVLSADLSRRYIYKRSKKEYPCSIDLWMICEGSDWESAHPTVVSMCVNGRVARRTILVLENNPQFRDLNLGFGFLCWEEEVSLLADNGIAASEVELSQCDSLRLCGSRVLITSFPFSTASRLNQATIGGVLLLNGTYYGLSTAHAFYHSREEQNTHHFNGNGQGDAGDMCEASEDTGDWENYLNGLNGLEASINGEEDSSALTALEPPSPTVVYLAREPVSSDTHIPEAEDSPTPKARKHFETSSLVGFLPKTPIAKSDELLERTDSRGSPWISRNLDWALIRIHDPRFWGPNLFESMLGTTLSTSFVSYSPPHGAVMIATRHNGPRLAYCWGRKTGLMLPNSITLQEVWCLDSPCCKSQSVSDPLRRYMC